MIYLVRHYLQNGFYHYITVDKRYYDEYFTGSRYLNFHYRKVGKFADMKKLKDWLSRYDIVLGVTYQYNNTLQADFNKGCCND